MKKILKWINSVIFGGLGWVFIIVGFVLLLLELSLITVVLLITSVFNVVAVYMGYLRERKYTHWWSRLKWEGQAFKKLVSNMWADALKV